MALSLALIATATGASTPTSGKKIDINAKRFSYQPSEITVKKGEPVTLVFHSQDVNHGFVSDEFHVKADIPKRGTAQVTFTPEEAGDFSGKCAHFCGAGHGQMQLTIHVTQ
jgi:cytochrome c oxidase subunit II